MCERERYIFFYITKGNISQSFFIAHPGSQSIKKRPGERARAASRFILYNLLPKVNYKKRSSRESEYIWVRGGEFLTQCEVFFQRSSGPLCDITEKHKNPLWLLSRRRCGAQWRKISLPVYIAFSVWCSSDAWLIAIEKQVPYASTRPGSWPRVPLLLNARSTT